MMQVQEIILTSMISEIITAITKLAALIGTPQPPEVQGMAKPATLTPSMTLITNLLQGTNAVLIWIAVLQMEGNLKTISSPSLYSLHQMNQPNFCLKNLELPETGPYGNPMSPLLNDLNISSLCKNNIMLHMNQIQKDQLPMNLQGSVMRIGSDTFGNPIFQNGLQNQPSSQIISILGCFAQLCQLGTKCENWTFKVNFLCQKSS